MNRIFLPDVSILVALHDSTHPHHVMSQDWFQAEGKKRGQPVPFLRIAAFVSQHKPY